MKNKKGYAPKRRSTTLCQRFAVFVTASALESN